MSSSSSDSDFSAASDNSGKMEALLQEWDAKEEGGAATFESDDDNDDSDDDGAKLAKLKASAASAEGSEESSSAASEEESAASSDDESASEASEAASEETEDGESEYEEEVVGDDIDDVEDEEPVAPAKSSAKSKSKSDDDDDSEVIDDGDITDKLKKKPKKKKEKIKAKKITDDIDENDPEAAEMKKLLGDWGVDGDDDEEEEDDDDDEESEASEREVVLEDGVIDHIVLAAPDLDEAMSNFEKMTGIAPKVAGTINGLGIKCARISFNDSSYLEIIAPDPKGPGPIGNLIKSRGIKELTPFHYAIRSSKAEDLKSEVKKFNYVPDHITMFGGNKDGVPKKWEVRWILLLTILRYAHLLKHIVQLLKHIVPYFLFTPDALPLRPSSWWRLPVHH